MANRFTSQHFPWDDEKPASSSRGAGTSSKSSSGGGQSEAKSGEKHATRSSEFTSDGFESPFRRNDASVVSSTRSFRSSSKRTASAKHVNSSESRASRASFADEELETSTRSNRNSNRYCSVFNSDDAFSAGSRKSRKASRASHASHSFDDAMENEWEEARRANHAAHADTNQRSFIPNIFAGGMPRVHLFSALPWPVAAAVPIIGIILIIVLAVYLVGAAQSCSVGDTANTEDTSEVVEPVVISYEPNISSIDTIADSGESISGFTLITEGDSYTPTLSEDDQTAITAALNTFTNDGYDVGFVIVDLDSGAGYSYNIDTEIYGASAIKAPVLVYGCQQALETGRLSLSTIKSYAEGAIVDSDNTSYYRMRNYFESYASISLSAWLESIGVDGSLADDSSFPTYSPRDSLKFWMNTYLYLEDSESNTDITAWLKSLFSSTKVSMIRDAVGTTDENASASVTVYNKAGWIDGTVDDAVNDAGIIVEGDSTYLISVMTTAPESDANFTKVSELVSALWDARDTLTPTDGTITVE